MKMKKLVQLTIAAFLLGTTLAIFGISNGQGGGTVSAMTPEECMGRWANVPILSQSELNQLKDDKCRYPEGPCKITPSLSPGQHDIVCDLSFLDPPGNDDVELTDRQCIGKYHGEVEPTPTMVNRLENNGCKKPDGPCEVRRLVTGTTRVDCKEQFTPVAIACREYTNPAENNACRKGHTDGIDACEDFSGGEKEACEDGANADSDSDANTDATCESEGGAIAWFVCSVISTLLDGAINTLDGWINNLLFVDGDRYQDEAIDQAWKTMRNIALLILVPMMMFMVIGTALNFGPFDPYTVKKALPRMFVATIFIVLSLPICQFGIKLSNVVGQGVGNIIINTAPSDASSITDIIANHPGTSAATGFAGIVGIAGATAAGFITLGVVGSFALVTFIALMMGFIILVMRQVLLITLMVLAPMAILVWIFPGNDKLWGIWKTTFIAMLLMYPIIAILLASGKFVAGLFG
jgi:hypothetical protein